MLSLIMVTACLCSPGNFIDQLIQPSNPTLTFEPEVEEEGVTTQQPDTVQDTPVPEETTPPEEEPFVESDEPWLILAGEHNLWVVDSNGNDLQYLATDVVIRQPLFDLVQPGGYNLAVIQHQGEIYQLNLIRIPDGKSKFIVELVQEQEMGDLGSPAFEVYRAITEQPSIAWAPDGQTLAFVGMLEGDSAGVYLYDTASGEIESVGQVEGQAFDLSWSEDGAYLVFLSANTFGTGAGYAMNSLWLYQTAGSSLTRLLDLQDSSGEDILGWSGSSTLILSSWSALCGPNSIRRLSLPDGKSQMIRKECYVDAAVSDEGGILYGTGEHAWLVQPDKNKGTIILDGVITDINWLPHDCIFQLYRQENPLVSVDRWGRDKQTAPAVGINDVTMYGAIWGWTDSFSEDPGVWTSGMGLETQKIFSEASYSPIWTPDNNLLFAAGEQLYRATFLAYDDAAPVSDLPGTILDSAWVGFD